MSLAIGTPPNNVSSITNSDGQGSDAQNPRQVINTAAASYLGMSAQSLQQDLGAGQSLAQVAQARGKSVDGLKTALTAALSSVQGTTPTSASNTHNLVNRVVNAHHTAGQHPGTVASITGAAAAPQPLSSTPDAPQVISVIA